MSSLMTNSAAMTALQTLRNINSSLATTQSRISTGYRVSTASDNSAYWSIATTMRSDNVALSAVSDALGLGAATIDTMYTALEATVGDEKGGLTALKAKLVAARTPGVDRNKIQSEIGAILDDLKNTADLAVFNGENWLAVDSKSPTFNDTKSVVASFSRAGGAVTINTIDVAVNSIKLYDKTDVVGAVTEGTLTGAFAAAAGTIDIDVGGTTYSVATTVDSTIESVVASINALKIDGLSVATDGTDIVLASRNAADIDIDASAVGMGTATMTAPATFSEKGILDQDYDYFDGTDWQTTSVSKIDISKLSDNATDLGILESYIKIVDSALGDVTQASADLGAIKTRIDSNSGFVKSLMDALDRGIGQLIDADMNAESTRLQALQVQQQLGIQALSIANSNSQSILSLFRG